MRSARWLWCAAVAGKKPEKAGGSQGKTDSAAGSGGAFRPLRLQPWQALGIHVDALYRPAAAAATATATAASSSSPSSSVLVSKVTMADRLSRLPPTALLYHGQTLGPRPLIILDQSLPLPLAEANTATSPEVEATARDGDVMTNAAAALARRMAPSELALQGARKFEAMLSHVNWAYGAVYIPLHVRMPSPSTPASAAEEKAGAAATAADGRLVREEDEEEESLLDVSCRQVVAVLDALDINWTHFLTYSYGTLVAARMAASRTHPHRIGSLLSLDTPLVTRAMVRNAAAREELAAAHRDVNVPLDEIAFAEQMLKEGLEGPLPCPAAELAKSVAASDAARIAAPEATRNEEALFRDYLFDTASVFANGGLTRRETRYTPLRALAEMQHPFQLIVPAKSPLSDVLTHKEFFGLRRPAVVKAAGDHAGLFGIPSVKSSGDEDAARPAADKEGSAKETERGKATGSSNSSSSSGRGSPSAAEATAVNAAAAAKEVGEVIGAWLNRFEQDVVLKRRYEQASKEMSQLMGGAGGAGSAGGGAGGADGKKTKKEKKEKKEKRKKG